MNRGVIKNGIKGHNNDQKICGHPFESELTASIVIVTKNISKT